MTIYSASSLGCYRSKTVSLFHPSSIRRFIVLALASTLLNSFPSFLNEKIDHRQRSRRISPPPAEAALAPSPTTRVNER
jgi:hypothetical protein